MTLNRKVIRKALIASFSVYLMPLATVHVVFVWGLALGAEIFTSESRRAGFPDPSSRPGANAPSA